MTVGSRRVQGRAVVVSDSAGVQIIDNRQSVVAEQFRASSAPLLVLPRDTDQTLFRVVGALELRDGSIVVANAGNDELLFFDASGEYLVSAGRKGGGPGEFEVMQSLQRLPFDTLMSFDRHLKRVSWFSPTGEFVRSLALEVPSYQPSVVGAFTDGAVGVFNDPFPLAAEGPERVYRQVGTVWLDGPDVQDANAILTVPGTEFVISRNTAAARRAAAYVRSPREFGYATAAAVYGDMVFVADNARFEIQIYDRAGHLQRIVRRRYEGRPIRSEDVSELRATSLARIKDPEIRAQAERQYADRPSPRRAFPAFVPRLLFDHAGHLWVSDYHWPPNAPVRWSVFDTAGVLTAAMETPSDLHVTDVGDDFVLGVWRDSLGVEYVRKYGLQRIRGQ